MKKVILVEQKESVKLSELKDSSHVGFIDSCGDKGYIAHVGQGYIAIVARDYSPNGVCNCSYGVYNDAVKETLKEALLAVSVACSVGIEDAFVFDTRKELYKWIAE